MIDWSLRVLGVGRGASHVLHGAPSTSFVLCADRRPLLWIDTGLGSTRACLQHFDDWPDVWLITHNHSDHAGELPIVLALDQQRLRRPSIIAEREIGQRLRQHRLAEHAAWRSPDALAEWHLIAPGESLPLPTLPSLNVVFRLGVHSERSSGFVLSDVHGPILGYTGDSAFDPALYAFVLQARCALLDMREHGNDSHAGFDHFQADWHRRAWIVGHGLSGTATANFPGLPLAQSGDLIPIMASST